MDDQNQNGSDNGESQNPPADAVSENEAAADASSVEASADESAAAPAEIQAQEAPEAEATDLKSKEEPEANLARVLEIPITVKVEVGNTRMTVEDLLNLGPGSVIELDKRAGEPVDIFVTHKMIATGEAVVVNEFFGVKISEIIPQKEIIMTLGK